MATLKHCVSLLGTITLFLTMVQFFALQVSSYKLFSSVIKPGQPVFNDTHGLVELLDGKSLSSAPGFDNALRILNNLKTAPGCVQVAVRELIHSCQGVSLEDRKIHSDILERAKTSYGIKAALCETSEGGSLIPEQCRILASSVGSIGPSTGFHDRQDVQNCLAEFQANHFYWVSYSNNRQQASVLCQASRIDIDREDALDALSQMVTVSKSFNEQQEDLLEQVGTALKDVVRHEDDMSVILQANLDLVTSLHEQHQEEIESIFQQLRNSQDDSVSHLTNSFGALSHQLSFVIQEVVMVANVSMQMDAALGTMHRNMYDMLAELSYIAQQSMDDVFVSALMLGEAVKAVDVAALDTAVNDAKTNADEVLLVQAEQLDLARTSQNLTEDAAQKLVITNAKLVEHLQGAAQLTEDIQSARNEFNQYQSIITQLFKAMTLVFDPKTWSLVRDWIMEVALWAIYFALVVICINKHRPTLHPCSFLLALCVAGRITGFLNIPVYWFILIHLGVCAVVLVTEPVFRAVHVQRNKRKLRRLHRRALEIQTRSLRARTEPPSLPSYRDEKV